MYAVIFEVEFNPGRRDDYFDIAAALSAELAGVDGIVSVERFSSLSNEGKVLSLSFWRDEDAIRRWRLHEGHRLAQKLGRDGIFKTYRLRVAGVVRDYGMAERADAPQPAPEASDSQPS